MQGVFEGISTLYPCGYALVTGKKMVASFLPTIANGTFFGANLHASVLVHDLNGCLDGGNIAQLRQQKRGQVGLMRHEGV